MGKKSRQKKERRKEDHKIQQSCEEGGFVSSCLKLIRWTTYLILFTPLIVSSKFFFPYVGPKSLYFMGLVEILLGLYILLVFLYPKYRPKFNPLIATLILFLVILILSTILGADPSRSFWSKPERMTGLLMWFHLFAFFAIISSVFRKKEDWYKIFGVSILVAILISFIALFAHLGAFQSIASRRGATIGNSSFLGTYLLFNIFLALYLLISFYRQKERDLFYFSIFGLSVIGLALFFSTAQAALIATLSSLVLLFFLYLAFKKEGILRWAGTSLVTLSLIFIVAGTVISTQLNSPLFEKILEKTGLETIGGRTVVWEKGLKGFLEKPLFGFGPENFELVFTKYYNPCMGTVRCGNDIWYDRAHNIIFDTLPTVGILGFLGYLLIFTSAFYILWQKIFQKHKDFWTAAISSVLLIGYFIQNLTVFDMINSYMMLFLVFGFIASLSTVQQNENSSPADAKTKNTLIPALLLIFLCFCFSKFIIQPLKTDYYTVQAIRMQNPSQRVALYKKALNASPLGKYQIRDFFADSTMRFLQSESAKKVPVNILKQELDFIVGELEKSIQESPLDFRSHLKLGMVYNFYARIDSSKLPEAEKVLKKAIELSPTNQQGYWALAQTKLYQKKTDEALSLAKKARDLEPKLKKSQLIVDEIVKIIEETKKK